jgi:hypothetical protein
MQNEIINEGGQVRVISGPKAVNLYRAKVILSGINLYLKTGMQPNRMYTPTNMKAVASEYTGKQYKNGRKALEQAAADLDAYMKSAEAFEGIEVINR